MDVVSSYLKTLVLQIEEEGNDILLDHLQRGQQLEAFEPHVPELVWQPKGELEKAMLHAECTQVVVKWAGNLENSKE